MTLNLSNGKNVFIGVFFSCFFFLGGGLFVCLFFFFNYINFDFEQFCIIYSFLTLFTSISHSMPRNTIRILRYDNVT